MAGIRGAVTVEKNTREDILGSTKELLSEIINANCLHEKDTASIIFTATKDLDAAFPAEAARQLG
ncbi:MAG: chorismate mutase, partial [Clostridia bacterium]|nr:chorismate mutase [Clostridia bacterium]